MKLINGFKERLDALQISGFDNFALDLFKYQARFNKVYAQYLSYLGLNYEDVESIDRIPFMPIEFFKTNTVMSGKWEAQKVFMSSGTTGANRSKHYVRDLDFYDEVASKIFSSKYYNIEETVFLALLPSYMEQGNSSLVHMVSHFVDRSSSEHSGFYLDEDASLIKVISRLLEDGMNVVLFGVTYALLDLAIDHPMDLHGLTIIETGGMKGRRKEITREELSKTLKSAFNVEEIHSEYGMTELMSQAYSEKDGIFDMPHTMRILIRDINDPFKLLGDGKTGGINIIDLANIHSCAFIETKDIGTTFPGNRFNVLGRFDNSDIRGCNLMVN